MSEKPPDKKIIPTPEQIVSSIKSFRRLYRNGSVFSHVGDDGSTCNLTMYTQDNALWGMLLIGAGMKHEAENLVDRMRDIKPYYQNGLFSHATDEMGCDVEPVVYARDNILFALLLKSMGREGETYDIIERIKSNRWLYSDNGLVGNYVARYSDKKDSHAYCCDNSLWGLLLHSLGLDKESEMVVEGLRGQNMCGDYSRFPVENKRSSVYGLFLSATGHDEEAFDVLNHQLQGGISSYPERWIYSHKLCSSRIFSDAYDDPLDQPSTLFRILLLESLGQKEDAKSAIEDLVDSPQFFGDRLLITRIKLGYHSYYNPGYGGDRAVTTMGEIYSGYNSLWGLALAENGYKLLTGDDKN